MLQSPLEFALKFTLMQRLRELLLPYPCGGIKDLLEKKTSSKVSERFLVLGLGVSQGLRHEPIHDDFMQVQGDHEP